MMISKNIRLMILLPLFCVLVLAACSSKTPIQQATAVDLQNLKYKNILFGEFVPGPGVQANVPTVEPLSQCKTTAISYLAEKNIFAKVENVGSSQADQDAGQTLIVEGSLTYLKIVSGAKRFWFGAMAGRSIMKIDIKLTDPSTGSVVAQQELMGAPGSMSGAWSVGGTDRALPAKMGYLVGDFILGNVSD